MTQNERTPAGANGEGSGSGVNVAADPAQIAPAPHEIQTARLRARFDFSPEVAAAIARLAYAMPEHRERRS